MKNKILISLLMAITGLIGMEPESTCSLISKEEKELFNRAKVLFDLGDTYYYGFKNTKPNKEKAQEFYREATKLPICSIHTLMSFDKLIEIQSTNFFMKTDDETNNLLPLLACYNDYSEKEKHFKDQITDIYKNRLQQLQCPYNEIDKLSISLSQNMDTYYSILAFFLKLQKSFNNPKTLLDENYSLILKLETKISSFKGISLIPVALPTHAIHSRAFYFSDIGWRNHLFTQIIFQKITSEISLFYQQLAYQCKTLKAGACLIHCLEKLILLSNSSQKSKHLQSLGNIYYSGRYNIPQNYSFACKNFERALQEKGIIQQDQDKCYYKLGIIYLNGDDTFPPHSLYAQEYLIKAAESCHQPTKSAASLALASLYSKSKSDISKDYLAASLYLQVALESTIDPLLQAEAYENLSEIYRKGGYGIVRDLNKSKNYGTKALGLKKSKTLWWS